VTFGWRASEAEDALQVDIYLESLLAAHGRSPAVLGTGDAFIGAGLGSLDPSQRRAAQLLSEHLQRFHPSFRFEEALAARLRAVAERSRSFAVRGDDAPLEDDRQAAVVLPFPFLGQRPDGEAVDDEMLRRIERDRLAAVERRRVLIGGAIASGVSLAGAAIVAWRAAAPPRTAFGRATRAAHRARPSMRGRA